MDVPSNQPVKVVFDRAVDKASVAARFHLQPPAPGAIRWPSANVLVFEHPPLRASTQYRAVLEPGYRSADGSVNGLRHGWPFHTEQPPSLAASAPAAGERDVDPATYVTLQFSREMDARTLGASITLSPAVRFAARTDPSDGRRVILAPDSLLTPQLDYSVTVTPAALDVDGNPLRSGFVLSFATGLQRPLRHWVGFLTDATAGTAGGGLWMVDEKQFPRQVTAEGGDAFTWSPDGTHLLTRNQGGVWSDSAVGGSARALPISASWVGFLSGDRGYAFLDGDRLRQLLPDGKLIDLAAGVSEAAVGPRGLRLALVSVTEAGVEVMGFDLDLHSLYRIQSESGPVGGLSWAPDGSRLAYRVGDPAGGRTQIRVRSLTGQARTATVASGDVGPPAWRADSRHLVFAATVPSPGGPISKAFQVSVTDASPARLEVQVGLPAGSLSVERPLPSPDGHEIAFLATLDSHTEVWLMNADGTGLKQLTAYDPAAFPYSCRELAWTNT